MSKPHPIDLTDSQSSIDSSPSSLETFDTLSAAVSSSTKNQCSTSNGRRVCLITGKKRVRETSSASASNSTTTTSSFASHLPLLIDDLSFPSSKRVHFSKKCRVRRYEKGGIDTAILVSEDEDMKAEAKESIILPKAATTSTVAASSKHELNMENSKAASKSSLSKAPSSPRQIKLLAAAAAATAKNNADRIATNIYAQGFQPLRQQPFRPPPPECLLEDLNEEQEQEEEEEEASAAAIITDEAEMNKSTTTTAEQQQQLQPFTNQSAAEYTPIFEQQP